jgi:hypothetical protein
VFWARCLPSAHASSSPAHPVGRDTLPPSVVETDHSIGPSGRRIADSAGLRGRRPIRQIEPATALLCAAPRGGQCSTTLSGDLTPAGKNLLKRRRIVSTASESVPKSTGFRTPLFAQDKSLFCWVSESSFCEGFRNT